MNEDLLEVLVKNISLVAVSIGAVYITCNTFLKNKREDRETFIKNQDAERTHSEKLANTNMEVFFEALYHKKSNDLVKRVEQISSTALDNIKEILKLYK